MLISCLFVFKCGLNGWMAGGLAFNISYNIEANRERKQNSPKTKTEKDMAEGGGRGDRRGKSTSRNAVVIKRAARFIADKLLF